MAKSPSGHFPSETPQPEGPARRNESDVDQSRVSAKETVRLPPTDPNAETVVGRGSDVRSGTPWAVIPDGAHTDLEGARIAGYELLEEIHRGGQGVVYRALQIGTKREVALKLMLEGPLASEVNRRRFEREVELAASLRHPHVVSILDSGVSDGRHYFAMEFIKGQRLDRYLAKVRPTLRQTIRLFVKICDAINYAHQRGVIHRDLKPPNVLVDDAGEPHVLDFGLAKPARAADGGLTTAAAVSEVGQLLGTVAYMSPEQTRGSEEIDVRSDVYSLGVMLYEALLGQLPHSVDGPLGDVLSRIANDDPQHPRTARTVSRFGRLVNDELQTILLKALDKVPARRYQTAGEFGRDLRHFLAGEPIEAKRASGLYVIRKTLKRYRLQATMASLLLVTMLLSLVALAFMLQRAQEARSDAAQQEQIALQRAIDAREARDEAQRQTAALERALQRQTVQRGDLALAAGDALGARDFYWRAHESAESPAAQWSLRQYYMNSGEQLARVVAPHPFSVATLSADGALALVASTTGGVAVRDTVTAELRDWWQTPTPADVLTIAPDGTVAAAGGGWIRAWQRGRAAPIVAAALPGAFEATSVHPLDGGTRVLVVGQRQVRLHAADQPAAASVVELEAPAFGPADYSFALGLAAVPTEGGVVIISIDSSGQLQREAIGPTGARPRLVRFVGDALLGLTEDVALKTAATGRERGRWIYAPDIPSDWEHIDFAGTLARRAVACADGRLLLLSGTEVKQEWATTPDGLLAVRLNAEGDEVIALDRTGTVTRWASPSRVRQTRQVMAGVPERWAVADDGSAILLGDSSGRVVAYVPERGDQLEPIVGPRPLRTRLLGTDWAPLAFDTSSGAYRTVVVDGDQIRLRERHHLPIYHASWEDASAPVLQDVALAGNSEVVAFLAQTVLGDRQQVSFWRWRPQVRTRRRVELSTLLPRAGSPVQFVGSAIEQMAFVPRSERLLVARRNGDLVLLAPDAPAAGPAPWLTLPAEPVALTFDRTGQQLAVACEDGYVRMIDVPTGRIADSLRVDRPVRTLAFGHDSQVLLVRFVDGAVRLYDSRTAEPVAQLAVPATDEVAFAAWLGYQNTLLLSYAERVHAHPYAHADVLIARNRAYAMQRLLIEALYEEGVGAAVARLPALRQIRHETAAAMRAGVLGAALRTPGYAPPPELLEAGGPEDRAAHVLLQLGHAAYDGGHFDLAEQWLTAATAAYDGQVDAYTALRSAQLRYLDRDFAEAAAGFRTVLARDDLDPADVPTIQLQLASALLQAGNLTESRRVALRIGAAEPEQVRTNEIATISAKGIVRYITGLQSEVPTADFIVRSLTGLETDSPTGALMQALARPFANLESSLDYQDDAPFFEGELARHHGDLALAAQKYQLCVDLARDRWPSNWARYRLTELSDATQ